MPSIAPWLSVRGSIAAVEFYKAAFDAVEVYRLEADGVVSRLKVGGSEFWVAEESSEPSPARLILTVDDPDTVFAKALAAGATAVSPVSEEHGWRVGRIADPFGHHWEIGRELVK
jgi:PhnB protein